VHYQLYIFTDPGATIDLITHFSMGLFVKAESVENGKSAEHLDQHV
jgi:hypothetical protein